MTTTTITNLLNLIEKNETGNIFGTKIAGGSEINGMIINFPIANALRTIPNSEIKLSSAEIWLDDLCEFQSVFIAKTDKHEFAILKDPKSHYISVIYFKDNESTYPDEMILQSIILLDLHQNLSGGDGFVNIEKLLHSSIKPNSEEASMLAEYVFKLEEAIKGGTYGIKSTSNDEYSINSETELLTELGSIKPSTKSEGKKKEQKAETVESIAPAEILPVEKKEEEHGLFQMSFLPEEEKDIVLVEKSTSKVKNAQRGRKGKKKVEEKPEVTLQQAQFMRPLVFSDEWVKTKLTELDLEPHIIEAALQFRKRQREEILTPEIMLDVPAKAFYIGDAEPIEQAIVGILTGLHLLIAGVTSGGKSTMVRAVLCMLNLPMYFAGGSIDASIETFVGFKKLEDGNISVTDAPLVKAMENGAGFVLDEGNTIMQQVFIQFHSVLDEQKEFYNEFTGEKIYPHPNFRFITTANRGGEYHGTQEFNPATLDRFVAIEMKHLKPDHMMEYLNVYDGNYDEFQLNILNMNDVSDTDKKILIEIDKAIKMAVERGDLDAKFSSTRNINALLRLTRLYSFEKAIPMIVRKYDVSERPKLASVLENVSVLNITATEMLNY